MATATLKKVAYYKGCIASLSAKELDSATQALAPKVGLELEELESVTCCGAGDIHEAEPDYYLHLNARILAYAAATGVDTLMTVCNVCTLNLRQANAQLVNDAELRARVNENLVSVGVPAYERDVDVRHLLWEIAEGDGYEQLKLAAPSADVSVLDGPSGRAKTVTFTSSDESDATVTGNQVRTVLDLDSTWFTPALLQLQPAARSMTYGGAVALTGLVRSADSSLGLQYTLIAIAAVSLGGTPVGGGRGGLAAHRVGGVGSVQALGRGLPDPSRADTIRGDGQRDLDRGV